MALTKRSRLERKSYVVKLAAQEQRVILEAQDRKGVTVFLSHSHKDADLILGALSELQNEGVQLYVDWLDPEMPRETSGATARRIKSKIEGHRKFVLLATENALGSQWVPWELGFADGVGKDKHMLVWPVEDDGRKWPGREYVSIYPYVMEDRTGNLCVQYPSEDGGRVESLRTWLLR